MAKKGLKKKDASLRQTAKEKTQESPWEWEPEPSKPKDSETNCNLLEQNQSKIGCEVECLQRLKDIHAHIQIIHRIVLELKLEIDDMSDKIAGFELFE